MLILVSYDVANSDSAGARRLRRVAKTCLNYGKRVQYSVFECNVDPAQWVSLRRKLMDAIDEGKDSLRFYFLGSNWKHKIEHIGSKKPVDLDEPLVV